MRLVILAAFALSSRQPFGPVLTNLLVVAANLSVILAVAKRERIFGPILTHWDEAAVYVLLSSAVTMLITISAPTG